MKRLLLISALIAALSAPAFAEQTQPIEQPNHAYRHADIDRQVLNLQLTLEQQQKEIAKLRRALGVAVQAVKANDNNIRIVADGVDGLHKSPYSWE